MASYNITLDFSSILGIADQIGGGAIKKIHEGVGITAQAVQAKWQDAVMQAPGIWQPERHAYVQSIDWRYTTHLSAVVETDLPLASKIEHGRPARDMKRMLDSSTKVRESKKGRYLIIPMRQNVPGGDGHSSYARQMPADIYSKAKALSKSSIVRTGSRPSGTGAYDTKTRKRLTVAQHAYSWGGRLPAGLAPKMKPHHTTDIHAGMVRMNTSTGKAKSSAYMTFRIMGAWQTGKWLVPAKPGLFIARTISEGVSQAMQQSMGA